MSSSVVLTTALRPTAAPPPVPPARQVEFLPAWYGQLRRRRRWVLAQVLLTVAVVAALPLGLGHTRYQIRGAEASLTELDGLRARRRQTDLVLAKLGRHVEPARVLEAIDRAAPLAVRVTEVNVESEPHPLDFFSTAYLAALRPAPGEAGRRVTVQLRGTSPSPVGAANLVAALSKHAAFRDVAMTHARERAADGANGGGGGGAGIGAAGGATVNEFRVTFWIDLTDGAALTEVNHP